MSSDGIRSFLNNPPREREKCIWPECDSYIWEPWLWCLKHINRVYELGCIDPKKLEPPVK